MKEIFFDVETTGLPDKKQNWETDFMLFPHIVQISWKSSETGIMKDYIIKPEGYEIPEEAVMIHGITTERASDEGIYFDNIILNLIAGFERAERIVGHNIYFDTSVIKANIKRYAFQNTPYPEKLTNKAIEAFHKSKRIDIMMKTISFCNIPQKNGKGKKYPTLQELHRILFNESFNAHNSKDDVLAVERCYFELIKRGVINGN
jgi:DNA polymerase-3 subunit alpha